MKHLESSREPYQVHIQKRKNIRWCALQRASDIGETRDDPPVQGNCINAARKVVSGSVRPGSRSWPTCLAMTAPALVLLSSHSYTQWGQLGEILGGVRFP